MNETKIPTAKEIADLINGNGSRYYDDKAKGWTGNGFSRIYFGRDYVTIENDGECHSNGPKARAQTIGQSAVDLVEDALELLVRMESSN